MLIFLVVHSSQVSFNTLLKAHLLCKFQLYVYIRFIQLMDFNSALVWEGKDVIRQGRKMVGGK